MTGTTSTETDLWAVHTIGMDDLHPAASRMLAVRNATWLNLSNVRLIPNLAEPHWPLLYNVPVRWEGSTDDHAEALAREEELEPRWSDTAADVIADLAAELAGVPPLSREATKAALQEVIGHVDYDVAKSLDPDTSESGEDGWPEQVDRFVKTYEQAS